MSISLMTEAWKANLPSGRKLVLLSLCDNANDQGECYPSIARISQRCGMSERAAQGHISELEKVGIVSREIRTGRSTLFTIHPRRICTPAESAPPQNLHPLPAESAPYPAESAPPVPAESAPITIIEPSPNHQLKHHAAKNRGTSIKASIFKVDDVDPQVWDDFVKVRKAKKMALTKTAVDGIRAEAAKAGMTLDAVLRLCCLMGWAGFKAAWAEKSGVGARAETAGLPVETAYQRSMRLRFEEATGRRSAGPASAAFDGRTVIDITPASSHAVQVAQ